MIIVSQDKASIINFDNVFRLYACTCSSEDFAIEPNCWCIRAEKVEDNLIYIFLGEYKTEERAKEVLQEIIEANEDFNYLKSFTANITKAIDGYMHKKYSHFDTYEMPEK